MDRLWLRLHRYRWIGWLMFALAAGALLWSARGWPSKLAPEAAKTRHVEFPRVESIPSYLWSPMADTGEEVVAAPKRNVHNFYRFAGAIKFEGEDGSTLVKAIVDDLVNKRQQMVAPGKTMNDELKVLDVQDDLMEVEFDGQRLNLGIRFGAAAAPVGDEPEAEIKTGGIPFWDRPALERNRYGKRIAEDRWVLEREKLMEYYQEVTNEPEALVRLFDSFRPARDGTAGDKIAGYNVQFSGLQPFLTDMGLEEGDTLRAVNSMQMTSQRRAEWFIAEFVRGNIDAFVLDVERGDETLQKVFIVR